MDLESGGNPSVDQSLRPGGAYEENARPARGLSNAFWGGGIALPVLTVQRRKAFRIVLGLVFGTIGLTFAVGQVVAANISNGWGVTAGLLTFVVGTVLVCLVGVRLAPSAEHGQG